MIQLVVEEYCHNCTDFSADVIKPQRVVSAHGVEISEANTIVKCEYRKRCSSIKRYLERQPTLYKEGGECDVQSTGSV